MIIVTGSPRSGTSLVMQTLDILGVPVVGEKFHEDFPIVSGNPKGYYDLPFADQVDAANEGGFKNKYEGKAVKLFGESLALADMNVVTHMIICRRRDAKRQDRSSLKLLKQELEVANESELRDVALQRLKHFTLEEIGNRRRLYYTAIEWYLSKFRGYVHEIYFEDMLYNTTDSIKALQDFLNVEDSKTLEQAIKNVGV